ALPPNFPADPYVYVSYTYDGVIGGTAPTWNDTCPAVMSCLTSGRVSRLRAAGDVMTGTEQVLVHDWCQQSDTHTVGDLGFGPDGALYAAGGEGATDAVDYGQFGVPTNPCGDPPAPAGGSMTPPTAQGGALRAQDLRTAADPTGLSGTLIRIDPATGQALPDNPLAASPDPNIRRIVAHGFRNPYRWAFRPDSGEIWVGDVGWRSWEEIDRVARPAAGPVANYGWPCHEGPVPQPDFQGAHLSLCDNLYAAPAGTVTPPHYAYSHAQAVVPDDGCRTGVGAVSGLTFYPKTGGNYPARYFGALLFADFLRRCVWGIKPGSGGIPNARYIVPLGTVTGRPVDLEIGPDQQVWYVDISGGTVRRLRYK
ncbi:MAG TPA: PQQ-dependent sugar dehydrogenase, partial [Micromonospora sp.]